MIDPDKLSHQVAKSLLEIGSVKLAPEEPFTWASGMLSPVYCDNRLTISYPSVRKLVCDGFRQLVETSGLTPEVVAGTATAGIPHAAWLADRLDLPMVYVRSEPKTHGRRNQIEGVAEPGKRTVVVEDVVSTGRSAVGAVEALRSAELNVQAVLSIFSYDLPASRASFGRIGVKSLSITNLPTLVQVASELGLLESAQLEAVQRWYADPEGWRPTIASA